MKKYDLVLQEFKKYYKHLSEEELFIKDLNKREIAIVPFENDIMIRHMSFNDLKSLKEYIEKNTPLHLYYSSAYYKEPHATDMNVKGWEGADLIFDVDADHIPTNCKVDHDKWICRNCNFQGIGHAPENCPNCGEKKIESISWICENCLNIAKEEVFKLIDEYLIPDFGVKIGEIEICFSGHRGYHIHVLSENFKKLSSDGRREIVDYVKGIGLEPRLHGFKIGSNGSIIGPDPKDPGWKGRIARVFYEYINKCTLEELEKVIGKKAEIIIKNREKILEDIMSNPSSWTRLKKVGIGNIVKIINIAIRDILCNIDERVTIDIKRLIRYPNSLHGKTGLKVCRLSYNDLEKFDPLKDSIVFRSGEIKIYVKEIPKIRIGDYEIGPIKDKEIEVPKSLGIYLLCKGVAELLS
ncbi:MAG: DNA primase small subunit PriS [Candidatus Verstraetearchaeota archaeon]|jgi:DNA primase small subunit|nr:DNA primase small subunit PriS [Candidatus Verstraetearchaeota archaeon]